MGSQSAITELGSLSGLPYHVAVGERDMVTPVTAQKAECAHAVGGLRRLSARTTRLTVPTTMSPRVASGTAVEAPYPHNRPQGSAVIGCHQRHQVCPLRLGFPARTAPYSAATGRSASSASSRTPSRRRPERRVAERASRKSARSVNTTVSEVMIDRVIVCMIEKLITGFSASPGFSRRFSRMRSNTTIVS